MKILLIHLKRRGPGKKVCFNSFVSVKLLFFCLVHDLKLQFDSQAVILKGYITIWL